MAGRATWVLLTLAALPLALSAAYAQTSEYDALPKTVVAAPPPPATASEKPAALHPAQAKGAPESKQKSASEKAAEKKAAAAAAEKEPLAAKKQGAALNAKQDPGKEEEVPGARRMAPSAAIPPFPGDEKGPKTIEFLGACPGNFDRCMDQVREIGEKMSATELCIPSEIYFATVTDRVRKWATLRPDIHGQPAPRVIAAALRSIYPCKHAVPARTAADKGGKAKAAQ